MASVTKPEIQDPSIINMADPVINTVKNGVQMNIADIMGIIDQLKEQVNELETKVGHLKEINVSLKDELRVSSSSSPAATAAAAETTKQAVEIRAKVQEAPAEKKIVGVAPPPPSPLSEEWDDMKYLLPNSSEINNNIPQMDNNNNGNMALSVSLSATTTKEIEEMKQSAPASNSTVTSQHLPQRHDVINKMEEACSDSKQQQHKGHVSSWQSRTNGMNNKNILKYKKKKPFLKIIVRKKSRKKIGILQNLPSSTQNNVARFSRNVWQLTSKNPEYRSNSLSKVRLILQKDRNIGNKKYFIASLVEREKSNSFKRRKKKMDKPATVLQGPSTCVANSLLSLLA